MAELITVELVWMATAAFLRLAGNAKGCRGRLKGLARRLEFLQSHWEAMALTEKELRYIYDVVKEATTFVEKELARKGAAWVRSALSPSTTQQLSEFEKRITELRDDLSATMKLPAPSRQETAWRLAEDAQELKLCGSSDPTLQAIPVEEYDKVLSQQLPITEGVAESLIDISPAFPPELRAPLDLLVVLDVSSSMGLINTDVIERTLGRKLTAADYVGSKDASSISDGVRVSGVLKNEIWAVLRERKAPSPLRVCQNTLIDLMTRLRSDLGDRIGVVTFADTAGVLMPLQVVDPKRMIREIEAIEAKDGTNIEDALRVAFQHLSDVELDDSHLLEVWFLTDGVPSTGESNPNALKSILNQLMEDFAESPKTKNRPTLSTIGYKDGCDSDILRMLGDEGGGQMHMIAYDAFDQGNKVKIVLDQLLNNAFRTVCKGIDVFCTLTGGVFVGEPITSFSHQQDDDANLVIQIADLRRDEPKTFIVRYQPKQYPCFISIEVIYFNTITQQREFKTIDDVKDAILVQSWS